MKVKEARKLIEKIDNEVKNLQKLQSMSEEREKELAEILGLNNTLKNTVCISVNAMLSWKSVLLNRIEEAELE